MAHKIFKSSFFYGIFILLLCVFVFTGVMYGQMEERVFSEMAIEASYLSAGLEASGEDYLNTVAEGRRITLVDEQGNVIYDNRADPTAMENHLDRVEISDALEKGFGQSKHYSNTTTQTTLYYAARLPDGRVVRLASAQDSMLGMLLGLLSPIIWTLLLVSLLCGILSSRLAKQITAPINSLDLDNPGANNPYKELKPLVSKVWEQNRTIRRQIEELSARQREFDAITANMSEGLILVDNRGVVISGNASGMEAVSLDGTGVKTIVRSKCILQVCDGVENALAGRRYENSFLRDEQVLQIIVDPVVSDGQVSGAVILVLDITERERRDELRREFSANVTHELKTPLTSISGFAELMKEGFVPEDKMREFSSDIYTESRRLIGLIDDILRLSQIDEGSDLPESGYVDLLGLSKNIAASLKPAADKMGVEVFVHGTDGVVYGNQRILEEIIYNLTENAIKYNKAGGHVDIDVRRSAEGTVFDVSDTGIGIALEHQKRIFERFYRVDKSHSKRVGGTGLGLSIVRHGAKFHDAKIHLESQPGKGSRFTVVFPFKEETK